MSVTKLTAAQIAEVTKLYIAYFNRAPEFGGLNYHVDAVLADLNDGFNFEQAVIRRADQFYQAATTPDDSGEPIWSPTLTTEWFVRGVYQNVLIRYFGNDEPTWAEVSYWMGRLEDGLSRGAMVREFLAAVDTLAADGTPEEQAISAKVQAALVNRVAVGLAFAEEEVSGHLTGRQAYLAGTDVMVFVSDDPETVASAFANIADNAPKQLELTLGYDHLIGGWGNDVFVATPEDIQGGDYSDYVDGGLGDADTLRVIDDSVTAFTWPVGTISTDGIENFSIAKAGGDISIQGEYATSSSTLRESTALEIELGDTSEIDLDIASSFSIVRINGGGAVFIDDHAPEENKVLRAISLDGSAGKVLIGAAAEVRLENLSVTRSASDVTIYAPIAERSLALSLNGVTGGTIADGEATGLAVSSTGANSSGLSIFAATVRSASIVATADLGIDQLRIGRAENLTMSGTGEITIARLASQTLASIDASALMGDLEIQNELIGGTAYRGSAGADTIRVPLFLSQLADIRLGEGDDTIFVGIGDFGFKEVPSGVIAGERGYDTLVLEPFSDWTTEHWDALGDMLSGFEQLRLMGWNTAYLDRIQPFARIDATEFIGYIDQLRTGATLIGGSARAGMQLNADGSDTTLNLVVRDSASFESANLDHLAVQFVPGGEHKFTSLSSNLKSFAAMGGSDRAMISIDTGSALETIDLRGMGTSATTVSMWGFGGGSGFFTIDQLTVLSGDGNTEVTKDFYGYFRIVDLTVATGSGDDVIALSGERGAIRTGDGDDLISGGLGTGIVDAGAGDDVVLAAGTIVLGAGADIASVYLVGLTAATVTDFNIAEDHLYIGNPAIFVGNATGRDAALALFRGTGSAELAYDAETGTLYHDQNGDGAIDEEHDVSIVLTGVAELNAGHFVTEF